MSIYEDFLEEILNMAADIGISDPRMEQAIKDDPFGIDPISAAEIITGKNVHDDKQTANLSFCILHAQARAKNAILSDTDDTTFTCDADKYRKIIESIGFIEIAKYCSEVQGTREYQYIHWFDGMLLVWDTHHGNRNAANVHTFIKRINDDKVYPTFGCSHGPWDNGISSIYFDAREAIKKNLASLKNDFEILKQWPNMSSFIWLNAHWENNLDSGEIAKQKINKFPVDVKKAIGDSVYF